MSGIEGTPSTRRTLRGRAGATPAASKASKRGQGSKRSRVVVEEEEEEEEQQEQQQQLQQPTQTTIASSQSTSSIQQENGEGEEETEEEETNGAFSSTSTTTTSSFKESVAVSSSSSTRKARLEEKAELSLLNQRLQLYIMNVREREASSGGLRSEIDILRQQHVLGAEQQKHAADERMGQMKQQRDAQSKQNAELAAENKRLADEISRLTGELKIEHAARADAEKRLRAVVNDLQIAQDRVTRSDADRNRLCLDLDTLRSESDFSQQQLAKIEKTNADAVTRATAAEQRAANAAEDLALLKKAREAEVALLSQQVAALTEKNLKVEDTVRREFGGQLKELLAERQEQFEAEKEQHLQKLRDEYEGLLNEKQQMIDSRTDEIDDLNRQLAESRDVRAKEERETREFLIIRETLEKQIGILANERDAAREKFESVVNDRTEQLREHQKLIKAKDKDFRDLMDVKVALDMEIAQYRSLIENEEDRLGLHAVVHVQKAKRETTAAKRR